MRAVTVDTGEVFPRQDQPRQHPARPRCPVAYRDLPPAALIEHAIIRGEGVLADQGALSVTTGEHTGRSPKDKYLVRQGALAREIWWGDVNQPMSVEAFTALRSDIQEHLAQHDSYHANLSVGADPAYALPVRLHSENAWSALFAHNLLLGGGDTAQGDEWTIWHAPTMAARPDRHQTRSSTAIAMSFDERAVLIAGTRYAGEIKKAMFTVMNGWLPPRGVLPMHCSANEGPQGDTALFFGLSGTGKTTLSTGGGRRLIGDDEHGWSDAGIFNFEGGCYAKTIGLSAESEPDIYRAAQQFGSVLENVVLDPATRSPQFEDDSRTENTRAAFPLQYLDPDAGGTGTHPRNIIFLSADAYGVLPPVARLSRDQALYWFLSGYTSKLAGTERGVTDPEATFSPCFGGPFLPLPPQTYARLLGERLDKTGSAVWLVNSGWSGGSIGTGQRMPIALTRAVVAAILSGAAADVATIADPTFGFAVPTAIPGVPDALLQPRASWADTERFDATSARLAREMAENFGQFAAGVPAHLRDAGPVPGGHTSHLP
ncbi:MAG: phosphoenolpyruvate carboxykinase (ATP) [Thermomicrobiales bacterium]